MANHARYLVVVAALIAALSFGVWVLLRWSGEVLVSLGSVA